MPRCPSARVPRCPAASVPRCLGALMSCSPGASMSHCLGASMPRCLDVPLPGAWVPGCLGVGSPAAAERPAAPQAPAPQFPSLRETPHHPPPRTALPGGAPPNRPSCWHLQGFGSSPVVSLPLPVSLVILTLCAFLSLLPSWDSGERPQSPPPGFSSTLTSSRSPSAQVPSTPGSARKLSVSVAFPDPGSGSYESPAFSGCLCSFTCMILCV